MENSTIAASFLIAAGNTAHGGNELSLDWKKRLPSPPSPAAFGKPLAYFYTCSAGGSALVLSIVADQLSECVIAAFQVNVTNNLAQYPGGSF